MFGKPATGCNHAERNRTRNDRPSSQRVKENGSGNGRLARRDARRSDHVTLMRGAAALAVATNMRAVHFRHEASS